MGPGPGNALGRGSYGVKPNLVSNRKHVASWIGHGPQEVQSNVPSSHYELGCLYSYRSHSYFSPILTDFYKTSLTRLLFYKNILTGMGLSWENILLLLFLPIFRTFLGEYSSHSRVLFTLTTCSHVCFFFQKSSSGETTSSIV